MSGALHTAVDPGGSVRWWQDALALAWRHPLRWLLAGLALMLALGLLNQVPGVGLLLASLATPPALGMWMLLAHRQAHMPAGEGPSLRALPTLLSAPQTRALLVLGAVLALAALVTVAAAALSGADQVLGAVASTGRADEETQARIGHGMLTLLLLLSFSVLVSAALWFAPALVVLRGMAPLAAMRASLRAVGDNALTFLLYAVVQLLLAAVATLPYHLGWLLLVPLMLLTTYASYRDVFAEA